MLQHHSLAIQRCKETVCSSTIIEHRHRAKHSSVKTFSNIISTASLEYNSSVIMLIIIIIIFYPNFHIVALKPLYKIPMSLFIWARQSPTVKFQNLNFRSKPRWFISTVLVHYYIITLLYYRLRRGKDGFSFFGRWWVSLSVVECRSCPSTCLPSCVCFICSASDIEATSELWATIVFSCFTASCEYEFSEIWLLRLS